jgi:hypothetical protein
MRSSLREEPRLLLGMVRGRVFSVVFLRADLLLSVYTGSGTVLRRARFAAAGEDAAV